MTELNKQTIKRFVHDTILMFRGLSARLAEEYGKTEFWISDLLSPTSETNGYFYPALLFMKRVRAHSPEAHAMLDDEWRRINDELRAGTVREANGSIDTAFQAVGKSYIELMTAYANRQGKGEIKALAAKLSAQTNKFVNALEPRNGLVELGGNGVKDSFSSGARRS